MKKVYGVFPSKYIHDIVSGICPKCRSLLCYECRYGGFQSCPNCGNEMMVTVTDEDLDRLEITGILL